jgi:drug/metabolite transporter (DMT)-like permease
VLSPVRATLGRSAFTAARERPVLTGIAGALCIASSGVLVRLADVSPTTTAVFRCIYALPFLGLLAAYEDRRFGSRPARARKLAALAGICFAADLILWHHAIAAVGAGLATVLGNLQVLVVGLLAWIWLGERPPKEIFGALPVVLFGVVLISGVIGTGAYGDDPALGVLFGALTSIAYAGFLLILRRGSADLRRVAGPLFDATLVAAVVSIAFGLAAGGGELDIVPSWPSHGWLLTLALTSQVVGWLLISTSLPRLPAALISMLLLVQPVGAMTLGAIVLEESPSAVQLAGAALILAGVLISTSGRRTKREDGSTDPIERSQAPAWIKDVATQSAAGPLKTADLVGVFVTLAGGAACMTLLFLGMRSVMEIGGACAEGGAFVPVRPCPKGIPLVMIGGIWGGIIFLGLYVWRGIRAGAPSFVALAWPALFLSLGWNFLEFGLDPPGDGGLVWGWLVCAFIFALMGGLPLIAILPAMFRSLTGRHEPLGATAPAAALRTQLKAAAKWKPPASGSRTSGASASSSARPARSSEAPPEAAVTDDVVSSLERLQKMRSEGALSEEEFRAAKKKVLEEEGG